MKDGRIPNAEGDEGQEEYKPWTRRHSESFASSRSVVEEVAVYCGTFRLVADGVSGARGWLSFVGA